MNETPNANRNGQLNAATAAAFFALLVFLMPGLNGFAYDNEFWINWCSYIHEHGIRNAYGSGTNYLPLYQYVLWIFGKLCGSTAIIAQRIYYLRIFTLAFEFWGCYLVYQWIGKRIPFPALLIIAFGNIAYSYNTLIWGQIDSVWAVLTLASLLYAWRGKLIISAAFIALALCTKLQAVMLTPLWVLVWMNALMRKGSRTIIIRIVVSGLLTALLIIILLVLPFAFGHGGPIMIWSVVTGSVGKFPVVTLSGDNMWSWLLYNPSATADDIPVVAGLSYRAIGMIVFAFGAACAAWPLQCHLIRNLRMSAAQRSPPDREIIWLTAALTSLLFFYCTTEMHERYAHAAGIFLMAGAFYTGRWGLWILFSIAYFLNLEIVMRWLALPNYDTLIFHARFISTLYAITIVWLAVLLYRKVNRPPLYREAACR